MAFGGFSKEGDEQPMAEINMVPLIDVMLVLLIIFMITAPLLTHAVKVELPRAASSADSAKSENVALSLDASGAVHWNGTAVSRDEWRARMAESAALTPQPELRIHADGALAYSRVAEVMSDAASAGLTRIGFVTDPREAP